MEMACPALFSRLFVGRENGTDTKNGCKEASTVAELFKAVQGSNRNRVQSNLDYPDLDYPDFSIIRTFSLVSFFFS